MRIVFVYPNPRTALLDEVRLGSAPDTNLMGMNHLGNLGFEAELRDSFLRRGRITRGLRHRVTWFARELTLPWEIGNADVLVTPLSTLLPLTARLRRRLSTVVLSYHTVAVWDRSSGPRRGLLRAALSSASGVIAVSQAGRQAMVERMALDPRRTFVAHLGVDERWWSAAPSRTDGYVLSVGRDLARDYETFGRAMERLDAQGVIVAKQENLRGVSLPSNVEVRLNVSPSEVRKLYAGSSCVVVPTHPVVDARGTENSGTISLLEAMASARPTVATARIYLEDYVRDDATVTVPPREPEAMRDAIRRVLDDAETQRSMGAAGRRHVESTFTTRLFAERLATIIRTIKAAGAQDSDEFLMPAG